MELNQQRHAKRPTKKPTKAGMPEAEKRVWRPEKAATWQRPWRRLRQNASELRKLEMKRAAKSERSAGHVKYQPLKVHKINVILEVIFS